MENFHVIHEIDVVSVLQSNGIGLNRSLCYNPATSTLWGLFDITDSVSGSTSKTYRSVLMKVDIASKSVNTLNLDVQESLSMLTVSDKGKVFLYSPESGMCNQYSVDMELEKKIQLPNHIPMMASFKDGLILGFNQGFYGIFRHYNIDTLEFSEIFLPLGMLGGEILNRGENAYAFLYSSAIAAVKFSTDINTYTGENIFPNSSKYIFHNGSLGCTFTVWNVLPGEEDDEFLIHIGSHFVLKKKKLESLLADKSRVYVLKYKFGEGCRYIYLPKDVRQIIDAKKENVLIAVKRTRDFQTGTRSCYIQFCNPLDWKKAKKL